MSSSDKENEPTLSNKSGRKKKRRSLAKTKQSFDKETILQGKFQYFAQVLVMEYRLCTLICAMFFLHI